MHKTGIFNWFGYILPIEERIRLIKEAGYEYVMLWWEDETYPDFRDKNHFAKLVKNCGLKLDNVHLPYDEVNLLWSDNIEERKKYTDKLIKWMNECKKSGVDTVVTHTTDKNNLEFKYSAGYDSFYEILKEAENIKLKVALENTQMFHYTDFILTELESDYLGFCYDSSHDFVNGESFGDILNKWRHRLLCVHLSDNDGLKDRHWIPGKGHVDWPRVIKYVKDSNCQSYSMEVYPYEEEKSLEPLDFLTKARDSILSIIN